MPVADDGAAAHRLAALGARAVTCSLLPWDFLVATPVGGDLALPAGSPVAATVRQWFWLGNVERLKGIFVFTQNEDYFYYGNVLPWFAWPAWPFAIWSLWAEGVPGLHKPGTVLPIVAFAAFFLFLSIIGEGRDIFGMPLLLPISLLAVVSSKRSNAARPTSTTGSPSSCSRSSRSWAGSTGRLSTSRAGAAVEAHDGHAARLPVWRTRLHGHPGGVVHDRLAGAAVQHQAPAPNARSSPGRSASP